MCLPHMEHVGYTVPTPPRRGMSDTRFRRHSGEVCRIHGSDAAAASGRGTTVWRWMRLSFPDAPHFRMTVMSCSITPHPAAFAATFPSGEGKYGSRFSRPSAAYAATAGGLRTASHFWGMSDTRFRRRRGEVCRIHGSDATPARYVGYTVPTPLRRGEGGPPYGGG